MKKSPIHLIADAETTKRIVMMARRSIGVQRGNSTASEFYETFQAQARERLAKLLAGEDINVFHKAGVPSAYFDTEKRELVLPIFKAINYHVVNYLLGHEVSHALYTPPEAWRKVVESDLPSSYYQITEDVRIEKLIKRKFPGLRIDFALGSLQFLLTDFYGINKIFGGTDGIKDASLIDKVCLLFKVNENMGADILDLGFNKEEQAIVDTLYGLETFEEMVEAAWKIYEYDKENQQENQIDGGDVNASMDQAVREENGHNHSQNPLEGTEKILGKSPKAIQNQLVKNADKAEDAKEQAEADAAEQAAAEKAKADAEAEKGKGEGSGEDGEGKGEGSGSGEGEGQDADGEGEGQATGQDGEGGENKGAGQGSGGAGLNTSGETFESDNSGKSAPKSKIHEHMEQNTENLVDKHAEAPVYYSAFNYDLKDLIIPYGQVLQQADDQQGFQIFTDPTQKHKQHQRPWVNFMVTDFEKKKAAVKWLNRKRNTVGKISPKRLYAYKLSNEILATKTKFNKGQRHGLVMVIDLSGSMGDIIDSTFKQVINLVNFCRKTHIPHQVYGFTDNQGRTKDGDQHQENYFAGDSLKMVELFNDSMNLREVEKMSSVLLSSYLGMPGRKSSYCSNVQSPVSYLGLGGTPLNSAVLATRQIVDSFRKAHKVEKMNVIFLTDGGACDGHITGDQYYYGQRRGGQKILVDHLSKRQYTIKSQGASYSNAMALTPVYIDYVRRETGSKVMNFFIDGGNQLPSTEKKAYNETGQAWAKDHNGWDGFFAISSEVMETPQTVIKDEANTTPEMLTSKRNNDRKSRVILSKFIDIIA